MLGYLVLAFIVRLAVRGWASLQASKKVLNHVFDSATFAGSSTLIWGILDPPILKLLGSTTIYLLVAGVVGVAYGIHSLWPSD